MKFELAMVAGILLCLLMLVRSCQNRPHHFEERMDKWREYRQERKQRDEPEIVDGSEDSGRREHRRRLFPRGLSECET